LIDFKKYKQKTLAVEPTGYKKLVFAEIQGSEGNVEPFVKSSQGY
jgi:hypothetical protein